MTRFDCDTLMSKLDELIDGTLDQTDASAAEEHLASCAGCRGLYERSLELQRAVGELPDSIEPDRDLWPAITDRIVEERVVAGSFRPRSEPARHGWLRVAAAAAVLIAAVTIAYLAGVERGRPKIAEGPAAATGVTLAAFDGIPSDLVEARNLLRSSLELRKHELSPETWTVVQDNLTVIDEAIVRIESALQENPDDGRLNRQLTVAYRRQIDLLQRAALLPAEV